MKNSKSLLVWAAELVTFLLSAFGGFLTKIAPPDQTDASFPTGIVSFLLLITLLIISALGQQTDSKHKRTSWITAGAVCLAMAIPAAFLYSSALNRYTYWYPPEKPLTRHVQASDKDLTELARDYIRRNPTDASAAELERNLPSDQIWSREAIAATNRYLLFTYLWLVLTLATAVFCLIEAKSINFEGKAKTPVKTG
ncbi:MAG TPA: hypothetical protein VGG85_01665 [Terracidiphilus sp.]|jgi:hypothetical protein